MTCPCVVHSKVKNKTRKSVWYSFRTTILEESALSWEHKLKSGHNNTTIKDNLIYSNVTLEIIKIKTYLYENTQMFVLYYNVPHARVLEILRWEWVNYH